MKKYNILRCGDQYGWAYHNVAKEHANYSRHNIKYVSASDISLDGIDLLYIHSPDISNHHAVTLPLEAKKRGIKVIGAYAGDPKYWNRDNVKIYSHADLIVTISPQTYKFAQINYARKQVPVVFLPESIDTKFFDPKPIYNQDTFNIGWAGGAHKRIKRVKLAQALKYPVNIQSNWGKPLFTKDSTLMPMREFYHNTDVFIVTSETECMPRVILEAMACGLPVISTNVGCVWMMLPKEWVVPVSPEETVIQEINKRLDLFKMNADLRKEVGLRNLHYVKQHFSWEQNAPLWDDVFSNVIEETNPALTMGICNRFLLPFKPRFQEEVDLIETMNIEHIMGYFEAKICTLFSYLVGAKVRFAISKENYLNYLSYGKLINEQRILQLYVDSPQDRDRILKIIQETNNGIREGIDLNIDVMVDLPKQLVTYSGLYIEAEIV